MLDWNSGPSSVSHGHVFLGERHEQYERKTWAVIWLCGLMTVAEIVGGQLFGSIALIADGLHMSTHAGALLLAALAYTYARKHVGDARFTFGTGKFGDLAGFTSAVILAMIAILIGYESVLRLISPVQISFAEAIPIAILGLTVNVACAWLLSAGEHHHGHGHRGAHLGHSEEVQRIVTADGDLTLELFEDREFARFRLRPEAGQILDTDNVSIEIVRPDGESRRWFSMINRGDYIESVDEIPEPHCFLARLQIGTECHEIEFNDFEDAHEAAHHDNNMRAAVVHVIADAAVSVLVIAGLFLAREFGWIWMDPLAGIVGSFVVASWSYGLIRDTGAILLDMNPDYCMAERVRETVEGDGDKVIDLHLWRLGPGHLALIVSIITGAERGIDYYRARLMRFRAISHLTIEITRKKNDT